MPRANTERNRAVSSPSNANTGERKFNAEQLGQRLLRLLEPLRVQSLSLHNGSGELLWLNEGVFGPDEHGYVLDALDLFANDVERQHLERKIEDGRWAAFLCARTPLGERCGLVMALVDVRSSRAIDNIVASPRVATLMRRFSMLLAPPLTPRHAQVSATPLVKSKSSTSTTAVIAAPKAATATAPTATHRPSQPPPQPTPKATPQATGAVASTVRVRRYSRLRPGGATRRYEVIAPAASMADDLVLATRVIEHLRRTQQRQQPPMSLVIPLSAESVIKGRLLPQLQPVLLRAGLGADTVGFCLPASAWAAASKATEQFIAGCAQCRCFVALDDFELGNSGFELLRSNAVRYLKLKSELVASVMSDKFSQATVAAIVQAARVLGLYCVAKNVESVPVAQWLGAAGIEFCDGLSRDPAGAATTKKDEALESIS